VKVTNDQEVWGNSKQSSLFIFSLILLVSQSERVVCGVPIGNVTGLSWKTPSMG